MAARPKLDEGHLTMERAGRPLAADACADGAERGIRGGGGGRNERIRYAKVTI